jgi:hypothetical protein
MSANQTIAKALADGLRAVLVEIDKGYRFDPGEWSTFIETVHVDRARASSNALLMPAVGSSWTPFVSMKWSRRVFGPVSGL